MSADRPPVVVLHGLGRTHLSMRSLCRRLEAAGFTTWSRTYPSRDMPVQALAELVADWIEADLGPDARPMAVTHSLGGILVRNISPRIAFSRVVMLAPPNGGSRLADRLASMRAFQHIFGPAGVDLAAPNEWPIPACPTAVVAGTRAASVGNPVSWLTAGIGTFAAGVANDGTVAVDETRLPTMQRFEQIDTSHTWIIRHPNTIRTMIEFLSTGDPAPQPETLIP